MPRIVPALIVVAAIALAVAMLPARDALGRPLPLSMLLGAAFGMTLQRGRFCFWCLTRDWFEAGDPRGLVALLVALGVGMLGTFAVFGAWLPDPSSGRLPPDAHIGPVSWVVALGAFAFGVGMAVSGSCISAHLYRLGEGSGGSIVALLGAVAGFGLGFLGWNRLYLAAVQEAPVVWLPAQFGYAGALALQLAALAAAAAWLLRRGWPRAEPADTPWQAVFRRRWPAPVTGLAIGLIATVAYLRVGPLGVTAELGSLARTGADALGWLPAELRGLDGLAGCATAVKETLLSRNGVFVGGLVLAALASALAAGDWKPALPPLRDVPRLLVGGILLGWGAMVSLGCTVGVLLSGTMAGAGSGWLFAACCLAGTWAGWHLRRRLA